LWPVSTSGRSVPRKRAAPRPARRATTGRPRSRPGPSDVAPRDEILAAATRLFATQGYAGTTMSQIAREAGLQQSSLYYWFNRKELILQAAFGVNRAPLDFVIRMGTEPGSSALRLYRLMCFDIHQLCTAPVDVNEVERMAGAQPDVFADFWADRQALHDWVERLVRAGMAEGELREVDPVLTALNLLSANEGIPNWFRTQGDHRPDGDAPFRHPAYGSHEVAAHFAGLALRGLLRRPSELDRIVRAAAAFDDDEDQYRIETPG
jgi:TetR/AcrR family transcriptional regulator